MSTSDNEPSMIIDKTVAYSVDGASVKIGVDSRTPYLAYVEISGRDPEHSKQVRKVIEKQISGDGFLDAQTKGEGGSFYILPFPQNYTQVGTLLTPKSFIKAAEELSGNQARVDELKGVVKNESKAWTEKLNARNAKIIGDDTREMLHYLDAIIAAFPPDKFSAEDKTIIIDALVKTKGERTHSRDF